MRIEAVFHRPLRRSAAVLALAGAGLAGMSAVLAGARHLGTARVVAFTAVAVVSTAFAIAVLLAVRWVLWLAAVVFGGQILAIVGTVAELIVGVDRGKAADLRALGFDPTLGVLINLAYSTIAAALFAWLASRYVRLRRTT
jgi:hypothetical protein